MCGCHSEVCVAQCRAWIEICRPSFFLPAAPQRERRGATVRKGENMSSSSLYNLLRLYAPVLCCCVLCAVCAKIGDTGSWVVAGMGHTKVPVAFKPTIVLNAKRWNMILSSQYRAPSLCFTDTTKCDRNEEGLPVKLQVAPLAPVS